MLREQSGQSALHTSTDTQTGQSIRFDAISRYWDSTAALQEVSFEVDAGSFTALLGPSGCGKSTALRLISGLDTPTSGRVLIGGEDVTTRPPAARDIAMVFQSYALFPHLSVAENIVFGLRVRRLSHTQRQQKLKAAAELLGLDQLLDRKPGQLSGGQQQRCALGRAIVADKSVFLMDEPLSNLDAKLRTEMREEIRALQRRLVDHIFVMTDGGPNNASSLLLFYIYQVAFDYWDTAYAATLTVVMLAILIALVIGQFFLFDRRIHYK